MTDFPAEYVAAIGAAAMTERSGTTGSVDTLPAGALVLWRNTGAGTHNITLTTNNTVDGLAVADFAFALTTGQIKAGRVPGQWGDVNGRVQLQTIDGTAAEVKYYILGGI